MGSESFSLASRPCESNVIPMALHPKEICEHCFVRATHSQPPPDPRDEFNALSTRMRIQTLKPHLHLPPSLSHLTSSIHVLVSGNQPCHTAIPTPLLRPYLLGCDQRSLPVWGIPVRSIRFYLVVFHQMSQRGIYVCVLQRYRYNPAACPVAAFRNC